MPEVSTPLLKLLAEMAHNKTQRITFDASSVNGILLFRDLSRLASLNPKPKPGPKATLQNATALLYSTTATPAPGWVRVHSVHRRRIGPTGQSRLSICGLRLDIHAKLLRARGTACVRIVSASAELPCLLGESKPLPSRSVAPSPTPRQVCCHGARMLASPPPATDPYTRRYKGIAAAHTALQACP